MVDTPSNSAELITDLSCSDARAFLLQGTSYNSLDLPTYFCFDRLLADIDELLLRSDLASRADKKRLRWTESVNYVVLNNKDGRYAWRPIHLIHPALYVDLVHRITEPHHWQTIIESFQRFKQNSKVDCSSVPLRPGPTHKDKATNIINWWSRVEQKSLELALRYSHLCCTDIADCYGSLYTHSIPWALHSKATAKGAKGDVSLIGNVIDNCLQDMSYGQTNGIPQGSILMDFFAEMVLGHSDVLLTEALEGIKSDFTLIRYRDDYRIFTNSSEDSYEILKALTITLSGLGLKLNSSKTTCSSELISDSIKPDKLEHLRIILHRGDIQKDLLVIHQHSKRFPNAGSLGKLLSRFYCRLLKTSQCRTSVRALVSIATDIAYSNPRCYPYIGAIISKLLSFVDEEPEREDLVTSIRAKLERLPNTGYMEIWLQRAALGLGRILDFGEPLCQLVAGKPAKVWESDWITSKELKLELDPSTIVDQQALHDALPVVPPSEVDLFDRMEY